MLSEALNLREKLPPHSSRRDALVPKLPGNERQRRKVVTSTPPAWCGNVETPTTETQTLGPTQSGWIQTAQQIRFSSASTSVTNTGRLNMELSRRQNVCQIRSRQVRQSARPFSAVKVKPRKPRAADSSHFVRGENHWAKRKFGRSITPRTVILWFHVENCWAQKHFSFCKSHYLQHPFPTTSVRRGMAVSLVLAKKLIMAELTDNNKQFYTDKDLPGATALGPFSARYRSSKAVVINAVYWQWSTLVKGWTPQSGSDLWT